MNPANTILNDVLIDMARSLLQYVSESFPWTSTTKQEIGEQVNVVAARQRQDVTEIVDLLTGREHFVDFGAFPTEYTDLQFLALDKLFDDLTTSQSALCEQISAAAAELSAIEDEEAAALLTSILTHQKDAGTALNELKAELAETAGT